MLKRLQDANSTYNVYDWDTDRKENVQRMKNICYFKPSILRHKSRRRAHSTKRGATSRNEPNKQLYDLYQQSMRMSSEMQEEHVNPE